MNPSETRDSLVLAAASYGRDVRPSRSVSIAKPCDYRVDALLRSGLSAVSTVPEHESGLLSFTSDARARFGRTPPDCVADSAVVRDGDPAALTDNAQPIMISRAGREVLIVPFDCEARLHENGGKLLSEIAVGEIDPGQAACS